MLAAATTQQRKPRVMVVDDEPHVRATIVALLEQQGHELSAFANGHDALAAYSQTAFDLVLADVKMPGMGGVELLRQIRAIDQEVPVILMTAYADLDTAVNAIKLGAFDFIIKPFDLDYLLTAIDKGVKFRFLCQLEQDYMAHLGKAITEKTRELEELHGQVVLSEKMAAIGLLSAGIAHEINNPVAFIASNLASMRKYLGRLHDFMAGQTELINSHCASEIIATQERSRQEKKIDLLTTNLFEMIAESLEGTERIKKIVGSLKTFARKDENEVGEANLNELVESTLTIVWNEIKYVASLTREFGDIPTIKCYPSQLNQIIMNLLVNAAHAITEGPGNIIIRTWADNEAVHLQVSDSGCGISPENMTQIFTPFFTTKEVGKGTGLGLSICHDIVDRHHGTIKVDSELGKGTTFTVTLPRHSPLQ